MAIVRSHHIALKVADVSVAKRFYTETLGFRVQGQIPGKEIYFIDIGGTSIELMGAEGGVEAGQPTAGFVHLAFEVDDVDATYEELRAKGVRFTVQPRDVGDIRLAFFTDPDGNTLELFRSPSLTW